MNVFIADIHFGRSDPETERLVERDLIGFLRHVQPKVERLYLIGDVFEHYIEYRHSVPKGFTRFLGLLAEWTDSGIPVEYYVGNHDPWHRDYFESELGVSVNTNSRIETLGDRRVYVCHGDEFDPDPAIVRWLKSWLRHPIPVWMYTSILPSDAGLSIAGWYSRRFRKTRLNEQLVTALRESARDLLRSKPCDAVVMGHSHKSEVTRWNEGIYMNPGCWFSERTAGIVEEEEVSVVRWNGSNIEPYST
jgi:UDP-2,3-diacylglucosamine hydrolase